MMDGDMDGDLRMQAPDSRSAGVDGEVSWTDCPERAGSGSPAAGGSRPCRHVSMSEWTSGAPLREPPSFPASFCYGELVLLDRRRRQGAEDFKLVVSRDLEVIAGHISDIARADRPTLSEHACTGDRVPGEASVPHLVEHLAIDLLVERQNASGGGRALAGYTRWLDRGGGLARVTLASDDPAVTETAMFLACGLVAIYRENIGGKLARGDAVDTSS